MGVIDKELQDESGENFTRMKVFDQPGVTDGKKWSEVDV